MPFVWGVWTDISFRFHEEIMMGRSLPPGPLDFYNERSTELRSERGTKGNSGHLAIIVVISNH